MKIERTKNSTYKRFKDLVAGETFYLVVDGKCISSELFMRIPDCNFFKYREDEVLNVVHLLNGNLHYSDDNAKVEVVTAKVVVEN